MFLVFSKEKIYTYCLSIITVILLFFVANTIQENKTNVIQTSTNIVSNSDNTVQNNLNDIENNTQ